MSEDKIFDLTEKIEIEKTNVNLSRVKLGRILVGIDIDAVGIFKITRLIIESSTSEKGISVDIMHGFDVAIDKITTYVEENINELLKGKN